MEQDSKKYDTLPGYWGSRYSIGFLVIGAAAAYFILTEHLAHVIGALLFLVLAARPLMRIFMHCHGKGDHCANDRDDESGALECAVLRAI